MDAIDFMFADNNEIVTDALVSKIRAQGEDLEDLQDTVDKLARSVREVQAINEKLKAELAAAKKAAKTPMDQRSPEWYAARLGKVTASRVADIVARTKTGYSTSRMNYMAELICERLTGVQGASYASAAMQWGVEAEPQARSAYRDQMSNNRHAYRDPFGTICTWALQHSDAVADGLHRSQVVRFRVL